MRVLLALALVAATLAGCSSNDPSRSQDDQPTGYLTAGPALWPDPQNAPHPSWNWPTLSNPAVAVGDIEVPAYWQPITGSPLPAHVSGMEPVAQVDGITQGAGIALFGSLAVVPEDADEGYVIDLADPTHPQRLSTFDTGGRGAAIIAYPNGRLVTALATSPGFDVVDITDPTFPVTLAQVEPTQGGHKLGVVPGTPILYNAASVGANAQYPLSDLPCDGPLGALCQAQGVTEIYDLTDPADPVLVQDFANGFSCHHIFFWISEAKQRAICAGIEVTQIWDIADPRDPKVIVSLPVHTGVPGAPSTAECFVLCSNFSHSAGLNVAGTVLFVGDEMGGGGSPPGCVLGTDTPVGQVGTPLGATWFYDVSDETNPRVLGYFAPPKLSPNDPDRSCTTHHGRLVPEPGRDLLAMSYYQDGVILVDFTGVDAAAGVLPTMVDRFDEGSDTWETWYANGYLFTGDLARGMDVLKLV